MIYNLSFLTRFRGNVSAIYLHNDLVSIYAKTSLYLEGNWKKFCFHYLELSQRYVTLYGISIPRVSPLFVNY